MHRVLIVVNSVWILARVHALITLLFQFPVLGIYHLAAGCTPALPVTVNSKTFVVVCQAFFDKSFVSFLPDDALVVGVFGWRTFGTQLLFNSSN